MSVSTELIDSNPAVSSAVALEGVPVDVSDENRRACVLLLYNPLARLVGYALAVARSGRPCILNFGTFPWLAPLFYALPVWGSPTAMMRASRRRRRFRRQFRGQPPRRAAPWRRRQMMRMPEVGHSHSGRPPSRVPSSFRQGNPWGVLASGTMVIRPAAVAAVQITP